VDVDVDLIGWVGVGLGGTYGCRCGILYAPVLGRGGFGGIGQSDMSDDVDVEITKSPRGLDILYKTLL